MTSMPAIDNGTLFICREDWEGDDGSGSQQRITTTPTRKRGGYERNFLEVILLRLWEGRFGRMRTAMKI